MIEHMALIMDGNRRWAKQRGLMPWDGHREGVEAVRRVVEYAVQKKIKQISFYAFSIENFKRSKKEIGYLLDLILEFAKKTLKEFEKEEIRVRFIGDKHLFPERVHPALHTLEENTKSFMRLTVNFLFCYGGRQELVSAAQCIAKKVKDGVLSIDAIDDKCFESCLWTHGIPDPELVIRTGGKQRLSNLLPYQSVYSEIHFMDCFWPDIQAADLDEVLEKFQLVQRNFGA